MQRRKVKTIIRDTLIKEGFDGLASRSCGCSKRNLFNSCPSGFVMKNCIAVKFRRCSECDYEKSCGRKPELSKPAGCFYVSGKESKTCYY